MSKRSELRRAVGYRLRKVRDNLTFTQDRMSVYFEMGRANYAKYENGETFPNPLVLEKLSTAFDVSLDWLMCAKGPMFFKEKEQKQEEEDKQAQAKEKAQVREQEERPLSEEYRELLAHMDQIPLLRHELLAFFYRFRLENKELVEASIK